MELREPIGHGAKRETSTSGAAVENKDEVSGGGAVDEARETSMVRDWGSKRCVHNVLHRVRDLLYRVLLMRIAYVRGRELQSSKDLHAEVFGETLPENESCR